MQEIRELQIRTIARASLPDSEAVSLSARTQAAARIADANAALVDAESRFPRESFAEIRNQRLLGIMVPVALGGEGATLPEIIDVCHSLGRACASTALIYAMHQIKMACIVRHAAGNPAVEGILRRVAAQQLLLASSTTEGRAGGNVRASDAAVERVGDHITLERKATVISYGREADGIVTTARRDAEATPSDQVLVVLLKPDYVLDPMQGWDTLGMRGTRSEGFTLRARADARQVLGDPYEKIHAQTMVPFAHLTWSAVWAGIAAAAAGKAQASVRFAARQAQGQLPLGAAHLTQALSGLNALRALISSARQRYEAVWADEKAVAAMEFQSMITLLKVQASEAAVGVVLSSLRACGLSGYRNDSEFSIGRHLRDVLSAPLMISNDRILANLAATSAMSPLPPVQG